MSSARTRGSWSIRLDAEEELAALRAGRGWAPSVRSRAAIAARVAQVLLPDGHRLWESGGAAGRPGFTWCPTPASLEELRAAGCLVPPAPDSEALVAANARETSLDLALLPGECTVRSLGELSAALGRRPPKRSPGSTAAPAWLLRGSLCAAGAERLVCEGPAAASRAFAERRMKSGPIHVAPVVDIRMDMALHGRLDREGARSHGRVLGYASGAGPMVAATHLVDVPESLRCSMEAAFHGVCDLLHGLGYFGPVGMDGFTWEDGRGELHLHAPSEINARYTVGFALGAPELVGLEHGAGSSGSSGRR